MGVATTGGPQALTVALCTSACAAGGYLYAGVEYSQECCTFFTLSFTFPLNSLAQHVFIHDILLTIISSLCKRDRQWRKEAGSSVMLYGMCHELQTGLLPMPFRITSFSVFYFTPCLMVSSCIRRARSTFTHFATRKIG